jgi:epoxyqueuosine reductase
VRPVEPPPPTPVAAGYVDELVALGRAHGLDRVGVAPAGVLHRARAALVERRAGGLADTMQFTYRNPERSTDPARSVAGARSVVVGARSYLLDEPERPSGVVGRVARYAWVDHYDALRQALRAIAERLRADGFRAVVHADDNSMVDREIAWQAGLGWFGKNANLLLPGAGSWFVLGGVVTTAELPTAPAPVPDGCGGCVRCLDACPTGAIVAPGVVDARRCLAWLVQRPGLFPREHRVALGDRFYGCDDCQEVCPPTLRWARAHRRQAAGPVQAVVDVLEVLAAPDDLLLERYGRWYLAHREVRWWRRNALVVLGNAADGSDDEVERALRRYLGHDDPVLRAHAVWAAARLGRRDLIPWGDPDPLVADELGHLPPPRTDHAPLEP